MIIKIQNTSINNSKKSSLNFKELIDSVPKSSIINKSDSRTDCNTSSLEFFRLYQI